MGRHGTNSFKYNTIFFFIFRVIKLYLFHNIFSRTYLERPVLETRWNTKPEVYMYLKKLVVNFCPEAITARILFTRTLSAKTARSSLYQTRKNARPKQTKRILSNNHLRLFYSDLDLYINIVILRLLVCYYV